MAKMLAVAAGVEVAEGTEAKNYEPMVAEALRRVPGVEFVNFVNVDQADEEDAPQEVTASAAVLQGLVEASESALELMKGMDPEARLTLAEVQVVGRSGKSVNDVTSCHTVRQEMVRDDAPFYYMDDVRRSRLRKLIVNGKP